MNEKNENHETSIKSTIDAVAGLAKAVPVYQDAVQPAAKQIGQSLEVVAKAVNIALAPLKITVWGYGQIEEYITTRVSAKLRKVPSQDIVQPPLQVAGPAIEALRFVGDDMNLRELYANLLATAMNKSTQHKVHPAYVEILKNMCSDEAILLQVFVDTDNFPIVDICATAADKHGYAVLCPNYSHLHKKISLQYPDSIYDYIDNLCRLRILEIPAGVLLVTPNTYEPLEEDTELDAMRKGMALVQRKLSFTRKVIRTTMFGQHFIQNVISEDSIIDI